MSAQVLVELQQRAVLTALESAPWPAETARGLAAAALTIGTIAQHKDGLRLLILHLRENMKDGVSAYDPPSAADTRRILAHPTVREVLTHFPDAVLYAATPIPTAAQDAA